jgi:transcriptional regulator with XRE-family HTH domain
MESNDGEPPKATKRTLHSLRRASRRMARATMREPANPCALGERVSQRHPSFIESGRAQPSRDMIVRLCDALDIPLRERNELLNCAGYAALYPERPLEGCEMRSVREALRRIINHHEPYPAFVVDRKWRIVMNNEGASRIVAACLDEETVRALSTDGCLNFMRMMFEPTRMRPRILNWTFVAPRLLARLRREAAGDALSPSSALLHELAPTANCEQVPIEDFETLAPTVPLEISSGPEDGFVPEGHARCWQEWRRLRTASIAGEPTPQAKRDAWNTLCLLPCRPRCSLSLYVAEGRKVRLQESASRRTGKRAKAAIQLRARHPATDI